MSTTLETEIRSIIQLQKQELMKLNEHVQRLTKAYETEKEHRKSLAKRCKMLEDIIGHKETLPPKEGLSNNHPTGVPVQSYPSQDSERAQKLEYRQHDHREVVQKAQHSDPVGYPYHDHPPTPYQQPYSSSSSPYHFNTQPQQHPASSHHSQPPQRKFGPTYQDQSLMQPTVVDDSLFIGGFKPRSTRPERNY